VRKTLSVVYKSAAGAARNPRVCWLTLKMAAWIGWLSLAVKFMPLPKALSTLTTTVNSKTSLTSQKELAATVDRLLRINLFCFEPVCWKRAAVLHRYLALNGIETRIVFGVHKDENQELRGHAWLEADGYPILENEPPNYTVTYSFPSTTKFDVQLELLND
jgi:hypothetical protein